MEFTQAADHKNWSPARKMAAREQAARVGQLETFLSKSPIMPTTAVSGFFSFMIGASELVESINL
jgi:hypothetical protein